MPRPDPARKLAASAPTTGPSKVVFAVVLAAALVVAVIAAVLVTRTGSPDPYTGPVPAGGTQSADGLNPYPDVTVQPDAPTVEVYEDFQCPFCKELESHNGMAMLAQAAAGKIRLVWHPVTFLEDNLKNAPSSTIATNGLYCAADAGKAAAYHGITFEKQPDKEGAGFSVADITTFGKRAGITGAALPKFNTCVDKSRYDGFVSAVAGHADRAGVNSTPTVFIDGKELSPSKNAEQYGKLLNTSNSFTSVLVAMTAK